MCSLLQTKLILSLQIYCYSALQGRMEITMDGIFFFSLLCCWPQCTCQLAQNETASRSNPFTCPSHAENTFETTQETKAIYVHQQNVVGQQQDNNPTQPDNRLPCIVSRRSQLWCQSSFNLNTLLLVKNALLWTNTNFFWANLKQ